MDRHLTWLRRRITVSIAAQTAQTFTVVAIAAFALLQWQTDQGPVSSLLAAIVIGELVALARVVHALHNNPSSYSFLRQYVDQSFRSRVTRIVVDEEPHPVAKELPRFEPVATIRGNDPSPVLDVFQDPSKLVACSVERTSGSLRFVSALLDGRTLVTAARVMPPHERLVLNLTSDGSVRGLISAHQRAVSGRTDVVEFSTSAHQVILDALAIEHQAFAALGPVLGPFLDIEPRAVAPLRLSTRINPAELAGLPTLFGQDLPLNLRQSDTSEVRPVPTVAPTGSMPQPVAVPVDSLPVPVVDAQPLAMLVPDIVPAVPVPEVQLHGTDAASMPAVPEPTHEDVPEELVGVGGPGVAMAFGHANDGERSVPRLSAMLRANAATLEPTGPRRRKA